MGWGSTHTHTHRESTDTHTDRRGRERGNSIHALVNGGSKSTIIFQTESVAVENERERER